MIFWSDSFSLWFNFQFETDDDPLDKLTAAEAIETLVESYRSSEYCSSANYKIDEISQIVSLLPV